ncbi:MAG TPA: hypothetical protein VK973_06325 [Arenicellales bacterium]|nr:hypothetical protein [Arenicellales bacterium]
MTAADQADERITTAEKVAFLSRAQAYGPDIEHVEVKETHMSWLFLAGDRVYKMKKPVRYPYLDFRSLEAREANCHAETRLNRRLAPDVYRGVARLTRDSSGALALNGEGETVDWLVVMRRLPEQRMLDHLIRQGAVSRREIERVADILARFYTRLEPVDIPVTEHIAMFVRQHRTNRELLAEPRFGVAGALLDKVLTRIDGFLERDSGLLAERVRGGRVIEGHGDLRPGHVCLCDPPVIIDCLEFNRVLRLLDPFDELADLALECERLGAAWIGPVLIERCAAELGDRPAGPLMAFYTAYRACLRARLAIRHLLDAEVAEPDKWPALAREYLEIAERACLSLPARADRPANRSRGSGG